MNPLLKRLLTFLFPGAEDDGVEPVDDPAGAVDDPASASDPAADDELEIDFIEDVPAPVARGNDADRLARLEAEVERRGRLVDQGQQSTGAPPVDAEFQREEERLRSSEITDIERWQINANRTLRATQAEARRAMFQAQDMADRTQFQAGASTDPRRAKYADRVEQAVAEERRQGRNASREAVYFYMLGKDIAEGKLKAKAKVKTPAADVPRGKSPAVRSNVPAARGATEHQKRVARLENVNI
ncbi:hypothetical protein [Paraburkholderia sp.]|uniref:hypothetical protein n=1 Tax=Paraburkholderia sp. TaxID=1926495 RepID=UPI0039E37725